LPAVLVLAWFHGEKGHQRAKPVELILLAGLVLVAAVGVVIVWPGAAETRDAEPPRRVADTSNQQSIAVLPFDNLSNNPENEYFSDGITEDILNSLSKISGLRVTSRTSVMRYKKTEKQVPEIARELNVRHVLEGSVRRDGNRVVISAQLIRADNDEHVWSDRYERNLTDIFAVQSEIAKTIADELNMRLSAADSRRLAVAPTRSVEAYDLYMKGRAEYLKFTVRAGRSAIGLLREAISIDPNFALATSLLARAYSVFEYSDAAAADSARFFAQQALERAPNLADAESAMGEVLRQSGRYEEALEHYLRALELEPGHAWSIAETGEVLGPFGLGRLDQAILLLERAIELDPAAGWMYNTLALAYTQLGDRATARNVIERGMRADPALLFLPMQRAQLALQAADTLSAFRDFERLYNSETRRYSASLIELLAAAGYPAQAERFAQAVPDSAIAKFDPRLRMAVHVFRGEHAAARRAAIELEADTRRRIGAGTRSVRLQLALAEAAMVRANHAQALKAIEEYVKWGGRDESVLRRHVMFAPLQNEARMRAAQQTIVRDVTEQRKRLMAARGQQANA
jgi:TolB-like protein/Tfp pilus assembly protein PilF